MIFEDMGSLALTLLFLLLGIAIGAFAVILFQRKKGGRTATQEVADYRAQEEQRRKEETMNARAEKIRDGV